MLVLRNFQSVCDEFWDSEGFKIRRLITKINEAKEENLPKDIGEVKSTHVLLKKILKDGENDYNFVTLITSFLLKVTEDTKL